MTHVSLIPEKLDTSSLNYDLLPKLLFIVSCKFHAYQIRRFFKFLSHTNEHIYVNNRLKFSTADQKKNHSLIVTLPFIIEHPMAHKYLRVVVCERIFMNMQIKIVRDDD